MRFRDLLQLALANLRRNGTRTVLTLVGVTIGVAALVALLSYGAGVQRVARSEFDALQLYNTLRVTSAPSPLDALGGGYDTDTSWLDTTDAGVPLTDSLVDAIGRMDGVLAAYPEVAFPAELKAHDREVVATVEAVPQAFAALPAYRPTAGAFFETRRDSALLVSPSMARRLGFEPAEAAVGQTVEMTTARLDLRALRLMAQAATLGMGGLPIRKERHPMRIAGLVAEDEQPLAGFVRVVAPLETAMALEKITFFSTLDLLLRRGTGEGYAAVRVQLRDADALPSVRAALRDEGVFVSAFRDQFQLVERLFLIMDLALGIVGFIALLVATIGITNTMMMNVLERTREIGVMKALGGDERDLQRLFVVESAALGAVGGLLGLLTGWLITLGLGALVDLYVGRLGLPQLDVFYAPPLMMAAVFGLAVAVSLAAGVAPARRAARVEPITALRSA